MTEKKGEKNKTKARNVQVDGGYDAITVLSFDAKVPRSYIEDFPIRTR